MLKFSKVLRGLKQGSRRKPETQFCALSGKMCHKKEKIQIKCIDSYIFIGWRVRSGRSVCTRRIIWYGQRGGIICGGLGLLKVSQKMKMAKKWHNFKTTVLTNQIPKFRLLFTVLNFLTSYLILLYPQYCYFIGSIFHGALNFSVKKQFKWPYLRKYRDI